MVQAPKPTELPGKNSRSRLTGGEVVTLELELEVVTPILGGAPRLRQLDELEVVRVPGLRGQLRFWWRALHGHQYATPAKLYEAERRLWGGAADATGGRSVVELSLRVRHRGERDVSPIQLYKTQTAEETEGSYALWVAQETGRGKSDYQPTAPRRLAGTRFQLRVVMPVEPTAFDQVKRTLTAWLLFGGYGARTRRGTGTLTLLTSRGKTPSPWLPAQATRTALEELLGPAIPPTTSGRPPCDLPLWQGARLWVGAETRDAEAAWTEALAWLRDFRQGQPLQGRSGTHLPAFARLRGAAICPGRSNWPEADKVRAWSRGCTTRVRHDNADPVWPKAALGLPIVGKFLKASKGREPDDFELRWRHRLRRPGQPEVMDRLASPLIVKAMPLAGGKYVPCALWLYRGYPVDSEVVLYQNKLAQAPAPFDQLVAPGDRALFQPLQEGQASSAPLRLREGFRWWMKQHKKAQEVF